MSVLQENAADHPDDVVEKARNLLSRWDGWRHGQSPVPGVAAAVYAGYLTETPDERPTQAEVADGFGCSTVALRKRLKDFSAEAGP